MEHWRRADYAVRRMRERGIVATCIFFLEKQGLPDELGANSEAERRLYRYGTARLGAFDNVFCLARPPDIYVLWLPKGGTGKLRLEAREGAKLSARWFDPRSGVFGEPFSTEPGERKFETPDSQDWVLLVRSDRS